MGCGLSGRERSDRGKGTVEDLTVLGPRRVSREGGTGRRVLEGGLRNPGESLEPEPLPHDPGVTTATRGGVGPRSRTLPSPSHTLS